MGATKQSQDFPPTYIIIQLSKRIKKETANWLINKIVSDRKLGGAELEIRAQPFVEGEVSIISVFRVLLIYTGKN